MKRRRFLQTTAAAALAAGAHPFRRARAAADAPRYRLSMSQWTFHRAFRGEPGFAKRDALEFASMAGDLGIEGLDYSGLLLGENHAAPKYLEWNGTASSNHALLVLPGDSVIPAFKDRELRCDDCPSR